MRQSPAVLRVRDLVDEKEWETRVALAACYRLVERYGMADMIYNHITVRVPGHPDHVLINPYGMLYGEITASSLYKIDLDGEVVLKPTQLPYDYGINKSGYVIHGAIHRARHDVDCIVHTHTRAGMAVSAMKCGLLPMTQTAIRFHQRIGYHDYEGPSVDLDEQRRLVADLGPHDAMILRNHGLLTAGRSIAHAFNLMYQLELACRAQVDAMAKGAELTFPSDEVSRKSANLYAPGVRRVYGELEWHALIRLLDRESPGYRD